MTIISLFIISILIFITAKLSAIETSVVSTDIEKILQNYPNLKEKTIYNIQTLLGQKEKIITAILISFTLLSTVAITMTASIFMDIFGKDKGQALSSVFMSVISVLFAEIIPKIIAVSHPEYIIVNSIRTMKILLVVFAPFNYCLDYLTPFINKIFQLWKNKKQNK